MDNLKLAARDLTHASVAIDEATKAGRTALGKKETALKSIQAIMMPMIKEIIIAHIAAHPQTPMIPWFACFTVEQGANTGLHLRFSTATNRAGAPLPHGSVSLSAGAILQTIAVELNAHMKEHGVALSVAQCTLPDYWWVQSELAKLPIY